MALNDIQWLICHKTKPSKIIHIQYIFIKRTFAFNNLQGWCALKPNQTIRVYLFLLSFIPVVLEGSEFLKLGTMYTIMARSYPIDLSNSICIFLKGPSSKPCNSFFILFIPSVFLLFSFCFFIFVQNCFASFASSCVGPCAFFREQNFLSLFLHFLFCLYCMTPSWNLLSLPSFDSIFWFISSSLIFKLICRFILVFSSHHILAFYLFLNTLVCHCLFSCSLSNLPVRSSISLRFPFGNTELITDQFR